MSKDYFATDKWHPVGYQPTQMDVWRWELLKKYFLNPLREWLGVPVTITNGLRTEGTFHRLEREGYHPSRTSDHFWGHEIYPISTAAADVTWEGPSPGKTHRGAFEAIKAGKVPNMSEPGQCILEHQDGHSDWLHISLPKWMVFGGLLAGEMPQKTQFLIGNNGRYTDVT